MKRGKNDVYTLVWRSRSKAGSDWAWSVNRGSELDDVVDNLEIGHTTRAPVTVTGKNGREYTLSGRKKAAWEAARAARKWRARLARRRRGGGP